MKFEDFDTALDVQKEIRAVEAEISQLNKDYNAKTKELNEKRATLSQFMIRKKTSLADSVKAVQRRTHELKVKAAEKERALAERLGIQAKPTAAPIDQAIGAKKKRRRQISAVDPVEVKSDG